MFISTGQFVHDVVPGIMRGRQRLNVLLASYNELDIPLAPPGPAQNGLEITLRSGGLKHYTLLPSESVAQQMERQSGDAQNIVDGWEDPAEHYDLAVVYLGLTGFDKALMYALGLRRRHIADRVVVITCDCNKVSKEQKLKRILDAGTLVAAIITPWCGGQDDFGELYNGFIEVWPQVRAT